jgi:hypothetical protein
MSVRKFPLLRSMKVFIAFFLLAACTPPTLLPPTIVDTPIRTPTETSTIRSIASYTATITPTSTQTPSLTPFFVVNLVSPDGSKRLHSIDWSHYSILDNSGNILWEFSYDVAKFGFIEVGYNPLYWTEDGRSIFLACVHSIDNGSSKFYGNQFVDGNGLYKFDTKTGEMKEIIPELIQGYYGMKISPDGSQLVYTNQTEIPVSIKQMDLTSNQEKVLYIAHEEILEIGSFGWSPKMDQILFSTFDKIDEAQHVRQFSIYLIDLSTKKVKNIVSKTEENLIFSSWEEPGQAYYQDTDRSIWRLSLGTSELSLFATKTPWPRITRTPKR